MKDARWSLDHGRTVVFRLVTTPECDITRNPFSEHQKRGKGHMGQIFHACIVPDGEVRPIYDAQLRFADWKCDSRGRDVSFWLDDEADRHPFAGYSRRKGTTETGATFAAVFVLIEEERAVDLVTEEKIAAVRAPRKLSSQVHLMITGPRFLQFLTERNVKATQQLRELGLKWDGERARLWVKRALEIESLSELDRRQDKAEEFHERIRKPFAAWNGDR